MARVFTTTFEFNHQRYDAIVTVFTQGDQLNFHIKLLDMDFHHLIPDGVLSYAGSTGFEQLETINNTVAQSLMRKLGDAINRHLVHTP
jgi:hypothetical protein